MVNIKRFGNLYEKIYDIDNLRKAHKNARKGKSWYKEVVEVDNNLDYYLEKLSDMLKNKTYKTSKYQVFQKQENNKIRTIYKLPYFPDRIAQWAIIQVIEPYLLRTFTSDTYSSIPNKGIHQALYKIKNDMHNKFDQCTYCLKIDIRHFYQNINHKILIDKYKRIFKDNNLIWLLEEIINSINTADLEDLKEFYKDNSIDDQTGIPIGNYLSQYSGNLYLSSLDHYIKEQLKIKFYYRYMDDIVILLNNKEELFRIKNKIEDFLYKNKLLLKSNWQLFPSNVRGIDFVGYRIFKDYILLRKSTCNKMKKRMNGIYKKVQRKKLMNHSDWASINSYKGWLKHCDSYHLQHKYLNRLEPYANYYYFKIIRGDLNANLL